MTKRQGLTSDGKNTGTSITLLLKHRSNKCWLDVYLDCKEVKRNNSCIHGKLRDQVEGSFWKDRYLCESRAKQLKRASKNFGCCLQRHISTAANLTRDLLCSWSFQTCPWIWSNTNKKYLNLLLEKKMPQKMYWGWSVLCSHHNPGKSQAQVNA